MSLEPKEDHKTLFCWTLRMIELSALKIFYMVRFQPSLGHNQINHHVILLDQPPGVPSRKTVVASLCWGCLAYLSLGYWFFSRTENSVMKAPINWPMSVHTKSRMSHKNRYICGLCSCPCNHNEFRIYWVDNFLCGGKKQIFNFNDPLRNCFT